MWRLLKLDVTASRAIERSYVLVFREIKTNASFCKVNRSLLQRRCMSSEKPADKLLPAYKKFGGPGKPANRIPSKNISEGGLIRWLNWLSSTEGRQAVFNGVVVCTFVVTAFMILIDFTFPSRTQWTYAENIAGASSGISDYMSKKQENTEFDQLPVSYELDLLFSGLGGLAKLNEVEHEKTSVFTSELMEPVSIGMPSTREGAMVGFPRHMMWTSVDQVDLGSVFFKPNWLPKFRGYKVPSNSDPELVQELKESLVLSKESREFIVSLYMNIGTSINRYGLCILPGLSILLNYFYGYKINNTLQLHSHPRWIRLGIQALVSLVSLGAFVFAHSILKQEMLFNSFENVVRTPEDADAAIEYHEKCLKRNQCLRKLLGPVSHYYFEEDGEFVSAPYEIFVPNYKARIEKLKALKTSLTGREELTE